MDGILACTDKQLSKGIMIGWFVNVGIVLYRSMSCKHVLESMDFRAMLHE